MLRGVPPAVHGIIGHDRRGPDHDTVSHEMSLHRFRRRHIATSHVMTQCDIAWTENCVDQASSLLLASLYVKLRRHGGVINFF